MISIKIFSYHRFLAKNRPFFQTSLTTYHSWFGPAHKAHHTLFGLGDLQREGVLITQRNGLHIGGVFRTSSTPLEGSSSRELMKVGKSWLRARYALRNPSCIFNPLVLLKAHHNSFLGRVLCKKSKFRTFRGKNTITTYQSPASLSNKILIIFN